MKYNSKKHLLFYPILFGLLGAFLGLITRFLFTSSVDFPIRNLVHSHSHVILLGFVFNALTIFIWQRFTKGIDKISYRLFIIMQICIGGMLFAFIAQGYALFSILFSTLHLWLSYVFLIRLWKRLKGDKHYVFLIQSGIVFHFISSIGPYCLGPLMALEMQTSPWYEQAIFFYLHFQYFGALFLWLITLFFQGKSVQLTKTKSWLIVFTLAGLYTHSLDYSFNHWSIKLIGGVCAVIFFVILSSFYKTLLKDSKLYLVFIAVAITNILGSLPLFANIVITEHFALIAWLHFLFLGLYTPFIWLQFPVKINIAFWIIYVIIFMLTEIILLFPSYVFQLTHSSVMWTLFITYIGIFACFCYIHVKALLLKNKLQTK